MRVRNPQPPSPPILYGPDPEANLSDHGINGPELSGPFFSDPESRQHPHNAAVCSTWEPASASAPPRSGRMQVGAGCQCSAASEAPSIGPGLSALPPCKMTATASTPVDLMASTGTLKLSFLPDHDPSLIQRRTTLV